MRKFLHELLGQLQAIHDEIIALRAELKESRGEMRSLTTCVNRLFYEVLIIKEPTASEHERESLRAEILRLRDELGIPGETPDDEPSGFIM